jgi:hypothetical protein
MKKFLMSLLLVAATYLIQDPHKQLAEKDRRAAIDSQIILDMSRQIAEREEEISRCWEEIRELQMTAWQWFKRWLKSELRSCQAGESTMTGPK